MTTSEALLVRPRPHGVLIADDEADVRDVLHDRLRQEGFSVWLAADGQEALDLYRNHCATIDVVLLDVRMPGLNGPQTLAALRELTPQIRCCFMSGSFGSYTEERLRDLGAATVFAKPFRLDEVAHVLGNLARHGDVNPWPLAAVQRSTTKETDHERTPCFQIVRGHGTRDHWHRIGLGQGYRRTGGPH